MNDTSNTLNSTPAESWFVATGDGVAEYHLDALKSEIKQGRVHLSTLVWRNGMQAWIELEQVPLLRMLVTLQPSPVFGDTSSEPATPVTAVSTILLDDFTDDKTTVLKSEVGLTAAPNHWEISSIAAQPAALELAPTGAALTEETAEPVTIRPDPTETTVTHDDPGSTSIFEGLFDNPALFGDDSDSSDIVADSDSSNLVVDGDISDNDLVADSDISDDRLGLSITESVSPFPAESSNTFAGFSDTKTTETAESAHLKLRGPIAGHVQPRCTALQELPGRPAKELAPQKPESLPTESLRPILARPATPRVSIAGVSIRPTEATPGFQALKREPISESLARSIPTRVCNEKPASATTPTATPKPLYTPLIQPPVAVPTLGPVPPTRAPPVRTRPSILPPLSPLPVTKHHHTVENDEQTAVISPTSTPKPKFERPVSVKPNSSVGVNVVIPVAQIVPAPLPHATNSAQARVHSSNNLRSSSPTLVGMPARLEPNRASAGSAMVEMQPHAEPTLAPLESTHTSEPTIIGMPPRVETKRAHAEPTPFGMQPYVEPSHPACTESTFIGMPPRLEPSLAPTESDQAVAPLSSGDPMGNSIYPSISSIHPALRSPRNVRRTLIMMGAVGVAAAASVVFAFARSGREHLAMSALSAQARAGNKVVVVPATETIETVEHPAAKSAEAPHQESAAADKPATVTAQAIRTQGSDTHLPMSASVKPVADEKIASANSGTRFHNSRLIRDAGVMPVAKSVPQVGSQASRNKATPTADWDRGTVEKRAWMSPGF